MKFTNNGHITEDTLKAFNEWLREMYGIRPTFIHPSGIQAQQLKEAIIGWRETRAGSEASVNAIPVWIYRLFIEFIKNNYERSKEMGNPYFDDRQINRSYIVNLLDRKPVSSKDNTTTGNNFNPIYMARMERRFAVPEGYDGNSAGVNLLVPPEVITWLHRRPYGTTTIARDDLDNTPTYDCAHPLLRANDTYVDGTVAADAGIIADGGYGCNHASLHTADYYGVPDNVNINHLTAQLYGNHRTNAFFFYQQYVKNGNIAMEVVKNKNYIEFTCEADNFVAPFMDYTPQEGSTRDYGVTDQMVAPKVLVNITYYKRGIY